MKGFEKPFRGLASVVEEWRLAKAVWPKEDLDRMPRALVLILEQADGYMATVERQETVNEASRRPAFPGDYDG